MYHTETPSATSQTYNPLQDTNSAAPPPSGQCPTAPVSQTHTQLIIILVLLYN